MSRSIAIVTALAEELEPLLRAATIDRVERIETRKCHVGTIAGVPVVLAAGGEGVASAQQSARELLRRFDCALLIGAGIAGGLSPSLRFSDLALASEVVSSDGTSLPGDPKFLDAAAAVSMQVERATIVTADRILGTPAAKRELALVSRNGGGALAAVDTESSGWARAAVERQIPFVVVRAIFDTVEEEIPAFVAASTGPDGTIDRAAVVRYSLLHPTAIPRLLGMREKLSVCALRLADFLKAYVPACQAVIAGSDSAGNRAAAIDDEAIRRLESLLKATSRTFALCIPLLPQPTRLEITIAYLLFRIADTFEDAAEWTIGERVDALGAFCGLLHDPDLDKARSLAASWAAMRPSSHAGYLELLEATPAVIEAWRSLSATSSEIIRSHVIRSAEGMAGIVKRTSEGGNLQLNDVDDLRHYCYIVAGIVGEMLTELFLLTSERLAVVAHELRARSALFGEALQLVNILKDADSDRAEGRVYIPPSADRAEVFALARRDLGSATEYTLMLQKRAAPRGIIAFAALPVQLASATLERVEKLGPGAKVGRPLVFRIVRNLERALDRNDPVIRAKGLR